MFILLFNEALSYQAPHLSSFSLFTNGDKRVYFHTTLVQWSSKSTEQNTQLFNSLLLNKSAKEERDWLVLLQCLFPKNPTKTNKQKKTVQFSLLKRSFSIYHLSSADDSCIAHILRVHWVKYVLYLKLFKYFFSWQFNLINITMIIFFNKYFFGLPFYRISK